MKLIYTFLLFGFLMTQLGMAQSAPDQKSATADKSAAPAAATDDTSGPTAFVQFGGNYANPDHAMGFVGTTTFDLGYRFNEHVSADIGLPLFTVRTPYPIVSTTDWRWTTIIGAPYIDIRYDTKHNGTNLTTMLTGAGGFNMVKTYSTGRMAVQWFNHADHPYQVLNYDVVFTPFLNFDAGTGTVDRQVMPQTYEIARPYETLGLIGTGNIGGSFTIHKHYKLSGSAYGNAPVGPQKMYSRIVSPDSLLSNGVYALNHNRFWDDFFETGGQLVNTYGSGPSRISRDNGYSMDLEVTRYKNITVDFGYNRSVHWEYGSAYFMLRYNFTGILRNLTTGE